MILLVGTANEYLVNIAKSYSADAVLITEDNWNKLSRLPLVGYTGIEEFNDKLLLLNVLLSATEIIYYSNNTLTKFDLSFPTESSRGWLENILLTVNQHIPVTNLKSQLLGTEKVKSDSRMFLELADCRQTEKPQLWGVGCSFTYGTGVESHQRYINLIESAIHKPISCLAAPGGSISWAADQILRSDIRKNDIVIWGVTTKERLTWCYRDTIYNITVNAYTKYKWLEKLVPQKIIVNEENALYQSLIHIHQVINFCDKIGAKLLLVGLLTNSTDLLYLHNLPNFYQYYNKNSNDYIDLGHDNEHPGSLQHQLYADAIIEQLQKRNWI